MKCKHCGEDVESTEVVEIGKRRVRVCEECAEELRTQAEVAEGAEDAMQGMMEYKGR